MWNSNLPTVGVKTNNFQGNVNNTWTYGVGFIRIMPTTMPEPERETTDLHRSRVGDPEMNGMTIVGSSFPRTGEGGHSLIFMTRYICDYNINIESFTAAGS